VTSLRGFTYQELKQKQLMPDPEPAKSETFSAKMFYFLVDQHFTPPHGFPDSFPIAGRLA
jgi:hypothetical protein